jgi:hypothetical protein
VVLGTCNVSPPPVFRTVGPHCIIPDTSMRCARFCYFLSAVPQLPDKRAGHFCRPLRVSPQTRPYLHPRGVPRTWSLNLPVGLPRAGSAADCPCQSLFEPSRSGFRPTLWCDRVIRVFQQFSRFALEDCSFRRPEARKLR